MEISEVNNRLSRWLNSHIELMDGNEKYSITIIERITYLFIKNHKSMDISGWGDITPVDVDDPVNPYDSYGLNDGEAMELIAYSNVIWGFAMCAGVSEDQEWFDVQVWDKVRQIHKRDLDNKVVKLDIDIKELTQDELNMMFDDEK
jgi:hypothetical protein